ncbi:MAG: UbiX family flavin prenyltransferase, partial [Faecalibacillus sp.]
MKKIVIGISGASGMPLAIRLLEELKKQKDIETHLVYTKSACLTILQECQKAIQDIEDLADVVYDNENIGASIASGTYEVNGMIVIPCSMKTVAGIKSGYTDNLLLRACDVMIKEHRKLVLVTRESPLSVIHLDNLAYLSRIHHVYIVPP